AGDLFQGTLESNLNEGAAVVSAYNALGYSASAVGNHEFDYGPAGPLTAPQGPGDDPRGALKARAAEARFPFLGANIIDTATARPVEWPNLRPSTIITVAGVRVGVVGLATRETLTATLAANSVGLSIAPLAVTLTREAQALRAGGATIVVAVAHAGGRCDAFDNPEDLSSCAADEEILEVARALPRGLVDVIVAGHRHFAIAQNVAGTAIISAFSRGRAFGRVDLTVDRASGRIERKRIFPPREVCAMFAANADTCVEASAQTASPAIYEGQPVVASAAIDAILAPAVAQADAVRNRPLNATVDARLERSGDTESALGNLLADWTLAVTPKADLAIINGGGLRADLPIGLVTYGRLFEVTPFDNRLSVVVLKGADLRRMIAGNLQRRGSIMLVSGVKATAECAGGELNLAIRRDSGRPVTDAETLRVATMDFLVTGGDDIFTPAHPIAVSGVEDGAVLRDEIATWLTHAGRQWRANDLFTPTNRRIEYPGTRPVTCAAP
ncbi:MAG: 5'-nucleotidase C-terminal domain-containing protein, partial [Acidobacteriota bacterium]